MKFKSQETNTGPQERIDNIEEDKLPMFKMEELGLAIIKESWSLASGMMVNWSGITCLNLMELLTTLH